MGTETLCFDIRQNSMSALGQKQTYAAQKVMSALPPIAGMCGALAYVRFVPRADIRLDNAKLEKSRSRAA